MNLVADLVAGIGSQTIAVIFKLYFDVVSAALLTSAQALQMNTHSMSTCVKRLHIHIQLWPIFRVNMTGFS